MFFRSCKQKNQCHSDKFHSDLVETEGTSINSTQQYSLPQNVQVWWEIYNDKDGFNIVISYDKSFYFKTFQWFLEA